MAIWPVGRDKERLEARGTVYLEAMIRASAVIALQRLMDSNITKWRADDREGFDGEMGANVVRLEAVAVERELTIVEARERVLFMSRRVYVTVHCRLRRPTQAIITTRSVNLIHLDSPC